MVSKATVLMIVLFAATLVSSGIGLYTYSSYSKPLKTLSSNPSMFNLMNKVSYLKYTISSPKFGKMYVVVNNDIMGHNGTASLYNGTTNKLLEKIIYKYGSNGLVSMKEVVGNATIPMNTTYYKAFYTSEFIFTNPYTGAKTMLPFPGMAPILGVYYIGNLYNISWKDLSSGQPSRSSPYASVNIGFVEASFNGKTYKAVAISIAPSTTAFSASATISIRLSATIIYISGVPVASQMIISTGASNYLAYNLTSIKTS
ncbi:MAG: hypothetical protein F7B61_05825 [Caldisphaeraceae archaeon]|nr:hypothetical protein [Caldisphaeraceae archaeon]